MVTQNVELTIQDVLDDIEQSESVRILFACESGSRAWGFESKDSDFDVRFIYVRPPDWYLTIDLEEKRDVIERPIMESLDVSGWDLRKALRLLRKSNPPLLEWLGSPIVYREIAVATEAIRNLARQYHSSVRCTYHYLHMARGNFREYLKGDEVWRKKYFYVLRPLFAVRWIERGLGLVPTEFQKLFETVVDDPDLKMAINDLLRDKRHGAELDIGPRIEPISDFIESELQRLEGALVGKKTPMPSVSPFNEVFRKLLWESWPNWCQGTGV